MKITMTRNLILGAALLAATTVAAAQNYPQRPVRFVVPYAPGGSTDTLARSMGNKMSELLGQQVVVDNRPGANGDIGMTIVARAPADGYSIVLGYIANLGIGPSLYEKMPYDPIKDFASITQVAGASNIFVIHPSLPAKTFKEFIAYTKANPKKVSFASAGVASVGHLTGELLNEMAGIDMQHIPYKGSGQAITDLVGGHIKAMISGMASTLPHVRSGKLVGIVTTGLKRTPATPDIPTIAETYPGFESSSWFGVLAPAGTPKPIIARLNADIHKSLQDPAVAKRLAGVGFEITYGTPEEFTNYIKSEIKKWAKVVKASGAKPD
ncbi:MAG: tripartite tricarboxylate transporter substrate binding protein [Burkholderiales bacterium]|nr:tripartite tricarboxylate transporter substrate binding protein [Burkholderiales bacterium]